MESPQELQTPPRLPDRTAPTSYLLAMPQEILNRIAEFVPDPKALTWIYREPHDMRILSASQCDLINLAKTCRLLHITSIGQLYSKSRFSFQDDDDDPATYKSASSTFVKFVRQIGPTNASYITQIQFTGAPSARTRHFLMQLSRLRSMRINLSGVSFAGSEANRLARLLQKLRSKHVPSLLRLHVSFELEQRVEQVGEYRDDRWGTLEPAVDAARRNLQEDEPVTVVELYEKVAKTFCFPKRRFIREYISPGVYRRIR